ncbi:MAG: response regulator [SAR324 cluster bacterium]|nr:response regulator [SAR324 cluster bacterium]
MKVLIIEDSKSHLKLLERLCLSIKNVQTVTANDGLEGYAILKSVELIDLIIIDQNMPFLKGTDFIAKIRSVPSYAEIPVIMSTAEPETEQENLMETGANAIFHKPFDLNEFTRILEELKFALG